jgi:hypothetical protein
MTTRALPGPIVDLIRDGVPESVLRRATCGSDCAVWRALVSTAASARQRGWSAWELAAMLDDPRNRLGAQAKIERGRPLSARRYQQRLTNAWESAGKWLDGRPAAWSKIDILGHVADVRTFVTDAPMTDAERRVMLHVLDVADKIGTMRPAVPWRGVRDATGLTPRECRDTLESLCGMGLLTLALRGRAAKTERRRTANCYRLPTPDAMTRYLIPGRVTRPMDQTARPMDQTAGPAPDLWTTPTGENMITLSFASAEQFGQFVRALDQLRAAGVPVPDTLPENVLPIRRQDRSTTP